MNEDVSTDQEEIHLQGSPVSDGIAIGFPYFISSHEEDLPEFPITAREVEEEIERYRRALFSSREDLERLQHDLAEEGSSEAVSIIGTHIQMLDDPLITTHMEEKVRQMRKNVETVFQSVITDYKKRFSKTTDSFFQQRLADVKDLSKRILGHLRPGQQSYLDDIPPNSILFIRELIPSDTASIQATRVSAVVTQTGGGTSHAALIARAKGIPFVASVDVQALQKAKGKCVIVDGMSGDVIVNPSSSTLEKYQKLQSRLKKQYRALEDETHFVAETADGYPVQIFANVNNLSDVDLLHQHGAAGIGLFRSEYFFLQDGSLFASEEQQYGLYLQLIEKAAGLPVVIRVLDLGGDKLPRESQPGQNPVLGCRGIRFLIKHHEIFRIQLRALLRAAVHGDVSILLPLISDVGEVIETKRLMEEVKQELRQENLPFKDRIPLGCMLEVPSAILMTDRLAEECDFFDIGTNDLIQFTLGVDRQNPETSDFYFPAHPSVIRMVRLSVLEAKRSEKPITICGEIASNPLFTPLLLGLGVDRFSCAPRFIPVIKKVIRQCNLVETYDLAQRILQMKTSAQITQLLHDISPAATATT
jgi:phosphoenolpyruvate-protein phosphotransferase (PTS system enzyme I)